MKPFDWGFVGVFITDNQMPVPKQEEFDALQHCESFSKDVAKAIKQRDRWTCHCGRSHKNGFRIDASHLNHDRHYPYYNHPDNGIAECLGHHFRRHVNLLVASYDENSGINHHWALGSVRLLANRIWLDGTTLEGVQDADRQFVIDTLVNRGINPDTILG